MKKILFGITSLTLGGAERVLVDLANKLSMDYDITIFTIYDNGVLKKQLNNNVKTITLYEKQYDEYSKFEKIKISLKLMFTNKPPENYDTYIAFLEGPITRLFSKKIGKKNLDKNIGIAQTSNTLKNNLENIDERLNEIRKIAWVHNDISKVFGKGFVSKIKMKLDKRVYNKYDKIIFVSKENQKDFNNTYGDNFNEEVIRNYLEYKNVIEKSNKSVEIPFSKNDINIVTVCRLTEQKAIERFIDIHAKLEKNGIHSKVYVVGDGPLRYSLQRQIDRLNETENFYLLGEKENPYPYIKNADYFCLLSYYEGYGMVIDEAKILNKYIIITDTAARESVENYDKSIILKNNEKDIYDGLERVIKRNNLKDSIEDNNTREIEQYYEDIVKRIEEVIK